MTLCALGVEKINQITFNFHQTMVGEPKSVSTVESGDNMATLPVSKAHTSSGDSVEKNNAANKEMELKNVMPHPSQRSVKIFQCREKSFFIQVYEF